MSTVSPREGGGGSSGARRWGENIDLKKGTELFLQQLAADSKKSRTSGPVVTGGLPPHILKQQWQLASAGTAPAAITAPAIGTTAPTTAATGPNVGPSTAREPSTPLAGSGQQQSGSGKQKHQHTSQQLHEVHSPPIWAQAPSQNQQLAQSPAHARTQGVSTEEQGLMNSRWAGSDAQQQPQPQAQTQAQTKRPEEKPVEAVRVSSNTYNGWSPVNHGKVHVPHSNDQQQEQQPTTTELVRVTEKQTQQWRPKRSYDLEEQSLPDSCKYSLNFNDDGENNHSFFNCGDPRGVMAGALDLVPKIHSKGFYNKNAWNEYPEDPEDPFNSKWRPAYCKQWVADMKCFEWPVARPLNVPKMQHEKCDVQPSNGWPMPPVDYPDTHINPEELKLGVNDGAVTRRLNDSAVLEIQINYQKLKRRIEKREGEQLWETAPSSSAGRVPQKASNSGIPKEESREDNRQEASHKPSGTPAPQSTQIPDDGNKRPAAQPTPPPTHTNAESVRPPPTMIPGKTGWHPIYGKVYDQPRVIQNDDPPTFLKIRCFLRPAEKGDLPQMLDIYNWEVAHGMQALDTNALRLNDMERLFKQCEESKTPIIVAIAGRSSEAIARKKATQHGGQGVQQQQSVQTEQDKVLGFAFISIPSTGLVGDAHHNVGRFRGQVHVYVASDIRKNGVGRALLQQITLFCSRHAIVSSDDFQWYDPIKSARYEDAFHNSRSYSRLYVEFASRGKADPDTDWMTRFLDSENYMCVSTLDKSLKVGYGEDGQVVNALSFQHDCQDPAKMKENDPQCK